MLQASADGAELFLPSAMTCSSCKVLQGTAGDDSIAISVGSPRNSIDTGVCPQCADCARSPRTFQRNCRAGSSFRPAFAATRYGGGAGLRTAKQGEIPAAPRSAGALN